MAWMETESERESERGITGVRSREKHDAWLETERERERAREQETEITPCHPLSLSLLFQHWFHSVHVAAIWFSDLSSPNLSRSSLNQSPNAASQRHQRLERE